MMPDIASLLQMNIIMPGFTLVAKAKMEGFVGVSQRAKKCRIYHIACCTYLFSRQKY